MKKLGRTTVLDAESIAGTAMHAKLLSEASDGLPDCHNPLLFFFSSILPFQATQRNLPLSDSIGCAYYLQAGRRTHAA